METLETAEVTANSGVANDFRGKSKKRPVTLLSAEVWQQVCDELNVDIPWTTRRSNLLVAGVTMPQRPGDIIQVGDVRLQVMQEVDPCFRMDEQCAGLKAALAPQWRGASVVSF